MYAIIKKENEEAVCRGCLSTDRRLTPLTNYDLYFILLDTKELIEDYKYVNILLCWECTALLRRTQIFRRRLQHAQYTLAHDRQFERDGLYDCRISKIGVPELNLMALLRKELRLSSTQMASKIIRCDMNKALRKAFAKSTLSVQEGKDCTSPLSTLKQDYKQDYDYSIEETTELKPNIDNHIEIDIKESHYENYTDNYEEVKIRKVKNVKNKNREKRDLKKIYNGLDLNNPDNYFSQLCLSEMEIEAILNRERDDNDVSRPQKCGTCGFRFKSKTELYDHRKNNHRRRATTGKCPHCALPYRTHWELELHCWRSHPVNRCTLCGGVVVWEKDRAKHLEQHKYRYRCVKCGVDFENKQLFSYHEKQLHSKYLCAHCGNTNATKKSLEKHIIRHHLPNKCPSCSLTFSTWDRLYRHTRASHARPGEEAYCVECDVSFPNRAKYNRHLSQSQRHRPRKKISVPCPECGKVFSRKNYMNNHRKLFHSNQSRHHCQLCDKYFVNGYSLRSHNKYVHEKIPMPKTKMCSVCGRGFGTNRVLENHMRTHTGERPFACAHCSAAFAQRVALKAHLAAIHKQK